MRVCMDVHVYTYIYIHTCIHARMQGRSGTQWLLTCTIATTARSPRSQSTHRYVHIRIYMYVCVFGTVPRIDHAQAPQHVHVWTTYIMQLGNTNTAQRSAHVAIWTTNVHMRGGGQHHVACGVCMHTHPDLCMHVQGVGQQNKYRHVQGVGQHNVSLAGHLPAENYLSLEACIHMSCICMYTRSNV